MADWCHMDEKAVLAEIRSDKKGLTEAEAQKRLGMYGENVLKEKERPQWWQVFLAQFEDLLVIILIGAAAVSMLTGDPESALVIFSVLLLNAVLGTVQHQKAEKSLDSLRRLSSPEARVVREGRSMAIPSAQVVPGDILVLETGDMVPADGRLLEVYGLTVNESSLTGESLNVEKRAGRLPQAADQPIAVGDRINMIFSGSLVTSGRAVAVVTATGMATEIGRIASLLNETGEKKTPLQISLDRFSGHLADQPGSVFRPSGPGNHSSLRVCICHEPVPEGTGAGRSYVCRGPGRGRHTRGTELHRHHCAGYGNPEDGGGARGHKGSEGSGESGLCLCHLLG